MSFITKVMRYLEVYLDKGLQFRAHKNLTIERIRKGEFRVR